MNNKLSNSLVLIFLATFFSIGCSKESALTLNQADISNTRSEPTRLSALEIGKQVGRLICEEIERRNHEQFMTDYCGMDSYAMGINLEECVNVAVKMRAQFPLCNQIVTSNINLPVLDWNKTSEIAAKTFFEEEIRLCCSFYQ